MGKDDEATQAVFVEYRKQLWDAYKLSHEQYDKALLTLSAGGLAISITLLKDLFPPAKMASPYVLVASWIFFCGSIVLTVISFLTSQKSLSVQQDYFEKYAAGDDSYRDKKNLFTVATTCLNLVSGFFFILAVISVTVFSITNFAGRTSMEKNERLQGGYVAPPMPRLTGTAPVDSRQPLQPATGRPTKPISPEPAKKRE